MWTTLDRFLKIIDCKYDVMPVNVIEDASSVERWALGVVPKNGFRLKLLESNRVCQI